MTMETSTDPSSSISSSYYNYLTPQSSSLLLQLLLQLNLYVSIIWSCSYALHIILLSDELWNYNGLAMFIAYVLAVAAESFRLYAGYSINLRTGASTMWLLLSLTPCVLLPTLVYLRLAAVAGDMWLSIISNLQLLLIALEALVALITHAMCTSRMARRQLSRGDETSKN